jgi:capsular polysaccharide biosynthesis protein
VQIRVYLRMLQEGWWLIALSALSALLIALLLSYTVTPLYRATARFLISPNNDVMSGRDIVNSLTALDKRVIGVTYAEVLSSDRIYRDTSEALQIDYNILRGYSLSAVVLPEASILEFSASGENPKIAALFANGAGQQGIEYIKSIYDVYSITFLDTAVAPSAPYNANPSRDAALALVLGLVLGAALALLRGHLRPPLEFMRRQRITDGPSGASTRGHALEQVEALSAAGEPPAVAVIRLDGLREAAEALPHVLQQRLLRQATAILRGELRGNDLVGRWDDRSFVLVLPGASEAAAQHAVQRISAQLDTPLSVPGSERISLQPRYAVVAPAPATTAALVDQIEALLAETKPAGVKPAVQATATA